MPYPKEPYNHALLLTADGQLRRTINVSHLCPKRPGYVIHPNMVHLSYSSKYFASNSDKKICLLVESIVTKQLPVAEENSTFQVFEHLNAYCNIAG